MKISGICVSVEMLVLLRVRELQSSPGNFICLKGILKLLVENPSCLLDVEEEEEEELNG